VRKNKRAFFPFSSFSSLSLSLYLALRKRIGRERGECLLQK